MTKDERFEEALVALKAEGFNSRSILLINKLIEPVLVAWPYVTRTIENTSTVDPDAWDFVRFDPVEWMDMAGLRLLDDEFDALFLRLKNMRLIYPDGSYPDDVSEYLLNLATGRIRPAT
jgi:hypothetical protein